MLAPVIRPARLRPGDLVRVVAASGPIFPEAFAPGQALLETRYRLRYDPEQLFAADGFLAGSDASRLGALVEGLRDPEAKAIFLGRGGHGLLRIVAHLDRALLRDNPKPIIGFSDGTVLLAFATQAGVASVHGPVVTQLPRLGSEDHAALFALLESPEPQILLRGLSALRPGSAAGPLLGGNLEVFSRLLGTHHLPDLDGAILFLEDVGERPYRIDRLLTHLELAGVFDRVAAVVVGDLIGCEEPAGARVPSPSAAAVIEERLARLRIPVATNAAIGHGSRNRALPYGVRAQLDVAAGTLVALEAPVS
jgi:muramoyltetrapeptide carboxypeptidase